VILHDLAVLTTCPSHMTSRKWIDPKRKQVIVTVAAYTVFIALHILSCGLNQPLQ